MSMCSNGISAAMLVCYAFQIVSLRALDWITIIWLDMELKK